MKPNQITIKANYLATTIVIIFSLIYTQIAHAQSTTNQSTVSNSAAPSASSVTTGGTNINYQTNNAYNNEMGIGPGIFCRTPTLYLGGNGGKAWLGAFDPVQKSGNFTTNYSANAGILFPFGSSTIDDCKSLVKTIARDREISSQLSMIKACDDLAKRGIKVDSSIYPLLEPCEKYAQSISKKISDNKKKNVLANKGNVKGRIQLTPKTLRDL